MVKVCLLWDESETPLAGTNLFLCRSTDWGTHLYGPGWGQCWELGFRWTGSATWNQCPLMSSYRRTDYRANRSRRQTTERLKEYWREVKLDWEISFQNKRRKVNCFGLKLVNYQRVCSLWSWSHHMLQKRTHYFTLQTLEGSRPLWNKSFKTHWLSRQKFLSEIKTWHVGVAITLPFYHGCI